LALLVANKLFGPDEALSAVTIPVPFGLISTLMILLVPRITPVPTE
jgi:hypothetical protein